MTVSYQIVLNVVYDRSFRKWVLINLWPPIVFSSFIDRRAVRFSMNVVHKIRECTKCCVVQWNSGETSFARAYILQASHHFRSDEKDTSVTLIVQVYISSIGTPVWKFYKIVSTRIFTLCIAYQLLPISKMYIII